LMEQMDVPRKMFVCRGALNQDACNYSMNSAVERMGIKSPSDMVLVFESGPGWNQSGGIELVNIENHHGEGCNILFVDGHVEFVKPEDIPKLHWDGDGSL
jgi:prepilin-type processing-associated H-X9-DG protein